jgi:hypothetical protein
MAAPQSATAERLYYLFAENLETISPFFKNRRIAPGRRTRLSEKWPTARCLSPFLSMVQTQATAAARPEDAETTSVPFWSAVACHRFGRAEQAGHSSDPFSEAAVLVANKAVASHRAPRSLFGRRAWPRRTGWTSQRPVFGGGGSWREQSGGKPPHSKIAFRPARMFAAASIVATRRMVWRGHGPWVETHGYPHDVATRRAVAVPELMIRRS